MRYYRALQEGPASIVVPIDKLSIVLTIAFPYAFFKERLLAKGYLGLALIVAGTLVLLLWSRSAAIGFALLPISSVI